MKRMVDNAEKLEKIGNRFIIYDFGEATSKWEESLEINGNLTVDANLTVADDAYLSYLSVADVGINSFNLFTLANNASISKIYDDVSGNSFCSVKAVAFTPDANLLETISGILSQKDVSIKVIFVLDGISYSVENITMKVNDTDTSKYDMIGTTMLMKGISEPINNVELKMRQSHYCYE